ncbi:MAG: hypothetical protein AABY61_01750 [Nitrospirota bacterium]
MKLKDGILVQGDGALANKSKSDPKPRLYVVQEGQRHLIRTPHAFRKGKYNRSAVQVIPDSVLERVPLAADVEAMSDETIGLYLHSFLGNGHYMTTNGALRKTPDGGQVDATTRTYTITMFGGFHGGVNMIYSDADGIAIGMSHTERFGVDGTWIGRSDRTDYWSAELSADLAARTTAITVAHFWAPDQLEDIVRRGVEVAKPIVELITDIYGIGGDAKSS